MIRINLHDYRDELRKIEIQRRVVKCIAIVIVAILLIIVFGLIEQAQLDSLGVETRKLESQVASLKGQVDKVKAMEARKKRLEDIIAGIEGLRERQMPASTIVSDLNLMVPDDIWLNAIVQRDLKDLKKKNVPHIMFGDPSKKKKKKRRKKNRGVDPKEFVEISGYALSENGIAEYLKRLQKIPYYKTTFLFKSSRTYIGSQAVHKFIIYCYLPKVEKKKSA